MPFAWTPTDQRAVRCTLGMSAINRTAPFPVLRWFVLPSSTRSRDAMPVQFTGPGAPFLAMP